MWNPLASRSGRLTAFFFLYLTEGIPLGFAATTIVTWLRQQNVDAATISFIVALIYLPWSFKWVAGPIVDCVRLPGRGRFRPWIIVAQCLMVISLASGAGIEVTLNMGPLGGLLSLGVLVAGIIVVNVFGAIQDVAIDALACNVLPEDERGTANGIMFAGAYMGQLVGGSVMLLLLTRFPISVLFLVVPLFIVAVTAAVAFPLRESTAVTPNADALPPDESAWMQIRQYPRRAFRAFATSRNAMLALLFAALPTGGYALSLALQTNLSVEFGLTTNEIAKLSMATPILSGVCCAIGGWTSDRLGRRLTLGVSVILLALPGAILAYAMYRAGWIEPVAVKADEPIRAASWLLTTYIVACLFYAAVGGYMYGIRTALFMDVCTPAVAATQFTAYMAILNLVITYTAAWHGLALKAWGYPITIAIDSAAGVLCLIPLALMRFDRRKSSAEPPAGEGVEPATVL